MKVIKFDLGRFGTALFLLCQKLRSISLSKDFFWSLIRCTEKMTLSNGRSSPAADYPISEKKRPIILHSFEELKKFSDDVSTTENHVAGNGSNIFRLDEASKNQMTVDLHGLNTFKATEKTLNFLNLAIEKECRKLVIIHGKGSGKLKKSIHEILKQTVAVKRFGLQPSNPGRTIAYF